VKTITIENNLQKQPTSLQKD